MSDIYAIQATKIQDLQRKLRILSDENEALKQQVTEANSTVRDVSVILQSQEREIMDLKQQVEQGKRDAVPEGLNECVARAIYMQWRDAQGYLHWQDGGNSLMQDSARRIASAAIAAALKQEK